MDNNVTINTLSAIIKKFVAEREWEEFHTPKNLSAALSVEAAELLEIFRWVDGQDSFDELAKHRQEVENELADVLTVLLCFANAANIDLAKAFEHKIAEVKAKYPVDKCKGKSDKYTAYQECRKKSD